MPWGDTGKRGSGGEQEVHERHGVRHGELKMYEGMRAVRDIRVRVRVRV